MRTLSLLCLLLACVAIGRADTELPDTLRTMLLTAADSPYHVRGMTVVAQNEVVDVEPGTELIFHPTVEINSGLRVVGILHAAGTEENPIIFRPSDEAAAAGLRWNGIYVQADYADSAMADSMGGFFDRRPVVVEWARISDANIGLTGAMLAGADDPDLEYNLICDHNLFTGCIVSMYMNFPSLARITNNVSYRSLSADLMAVYTPVDAWNNLFIPVTAHPTSIRLFDNGSTSQANLRNNCFAHPFARPDSLLYFFPPDGVPYYLPLDPTSFLADPMVLDTLDFYPDPLYSPLIDTGNPDITDEDGSVSDIGLHHVAPDDAGAIVTAHPEELRWVTGFDYDFSLEVLGYPLPTLEVLDAPLGFEATLEARTRLRMRWDRDFQSDGQFPLSLRVVNTVGGELRADTLTTVLNFQQNSAPRRVTFSPCPTGDCEGEGPLDLLFTNYYPLDTLSIELSLADFEVDSFGTEDQLFVTLRRDDTLLYSRTIQSRQGLVLTDLLDTTKVDYTLSYSDGVAGDSVRIRVEPRYQVLNGITAGVIDPTDGPAYITGTVRVLEQSSLNIPPGTRLIVGESWPRDEVIFDVEGDLEVAGSSALPIEFFSLVPWYGADGQIQDPRPELFRLGLEAGSSSFSWAHFDGFGEGIRIERAPGVHLIRDCVFTGCRLGVVAIGSRVDIRNCEFSEPADTAQLGSYGIYIADAQNARIRNCLFVNPSTAIAMVDADGLVANNSFHSKYTLVGAQNSRVWPVSRLIGGARLLCINSSVDVRNNLFHFKTEQNGAVITLDRLLTVRQKGIWLDQDSQVSAEYNWFDVPDARASNDTTISGQPVFYDSLFAFNNRGWLSTNLGNRYGNSSFEQETGFLLTADSPLIDAGDPGSSWIDSDGSRNDIGYQGGPLGNNLGGALGAGGNTRELVELPTHLELRSATPNPFNPSTRIELAVGQAGLVDLAIYDLRGARVITLANQSLEPGVYTFRFDGSGLASGAYFAHVRGPAGRDTIRLLLVK